MRIISRAEWGARAPRSITKVDPSLRTYFVVHYSGAPATQTVRAIQDWCMNEPPHGRGYADIDYNMLVRGTTGEIYEGRGWDVVGSHTTGYNTNGVGVCVISDGTISVAAKESVRWLYEQACARSRKALIVKGHRELATTGTDCPGSEIFSWVRAGLPAPVKEDNMTTEDIKGACREALAELIIGAGNAAINGNSPEVTATDRQVRNAFWKLGEQSRDRVLAAVAGVDESVFAILGAEDTPDQEVANALLNLLGDRAPAIIALMQGR